MNIHILLVEDYPTFRSGLRSLFKNEPDMQVVGEASDGLTSVDL